MQFLIPLCIFFSYFFAPQKSETNKYCHKEGGVVYAKQLVHHYDAKNVTQPGHGRIVSQQKHSQLERMWKQVSFSWHSITFSFQRSGFVVKASKRAPIAQMLLFPVHYFW